MDGALPMLWRCIPERYLLMGSKCESCGGEFFPQRLLCPKCRSKGLLVPKGMPTEGKVYSYTKVHTGPAGFEHETPYFLALIELTNGVNVLSQIVDATDEEMTIGLPVRMVFRKIRQDGEEGAIAYGYKFTPDHPRTPHLPKGPKKEKAAAAKKPQ